VSSTFRSIVDSAESAALCVISFDISLDANPMPPKALATSRARILGCKSETKRREHGAAYGALAQTRHFCGREAILLQNSQF
jgi:hypothetical protein